MVNNNPARSSQRVLEAGWYLVRTRALSEYLAEESLRRNGYQAYLPCVKSPKPRPGHTTAPLFPGYLFVRQENGDSARTPLNRIGGILGWVMFDGAIAQVPGEVVGELRDRVEAINESGGHWRRFWPGDKVHVSSGWMEGIAEVLEETRSPESRVRVLLNFMGRLVPATVPWQDLKVLEHSTEPVDHNHRPRRTRGRGRWVQGYGPRSMPNMSN